MVKGEYGVYCANCKAFIRFNSYTDYRPHFLPAEGGEKWKCTACGEVIVYSGSEVIYREEGQMMTNGKTKTYYRALPNTVTTPTTDRYVINVHSAFDWVKDIKDATSDYRESCEATQQKLKDQLRIETTLVELPDEKLITPKYVVCREQ